MKKIFLLLIVITFSSCRKEIFFTNFDNIDYYSVNKNDNKSPIKIIEDSLSKKNIDNGLLIELNSDKFIKKQISPSDVKYFTDIFNLDTFLDYNTSACVPIYRDILILKKSNNIVGIVKICLSCDMHSINGEDEKNKKINFGGSIQGQELQALLKKYK